MEEHITSLNTCLNPVREVAINIHSMPGGVVIIDQAGKITDANQAWHDVMLRNALIYNQQLNDDYFEIRKQFNQTDTYNAYQGINRVLAGLEPEFQMLFFCRFAKHQMEMNAISIPNQSRALISHQPENKNNEEIILPERMIGDRCFEALYESTNDGVLITHHGTGQILKYNSALQEICGFSELHLRHMTLWELIPSSYHEQIQKVIFEEVCLHKTTKTLNTLCINKNNQTYPITLQAQPLTDQHHNLVAISWFISPDEQHTVLEPMNYYPVSQNNHWAECNATHDLNNILSVIMMNSELLESALSDIGFNTNAVSNILSATGRATKLLSKISMLNSLPQLEKRPISCLSWLSEMHPLCEQLDRKIDINFEQQAANLCVYAHPAQLKQLLTIFCQLMEDTLSDIEGTIKIRFAPALKKSNAVDITLEFASSHLEYKHIRQLLPSLNPKKPGRSTRIEPLIINAILQELYGSMEIEHAEQFLKIRLSFPSQ